MATRRQIHLWALMLFGVLHSGVASAQSDDLSDQDLVPSAQGAGQQPEPKPIRADAGLLGNLFDSMRDNPFFGPLTHWGGNLELEHGIQGGPGSQSDYDRQSLNLNASTYFYQPWFALGNGSLGVHRTEVKTSGSGSSDGLSLTGAGTVNVLPRSRYPFSASLSVTEANSKGVGAADARDQNLTLRQGFQSRDVKTNGEFRYEYGQSSFSSGQTNERNNLSGSQTTLTEDGSYALSGSLLQARDTNGGARESYNLLASRTGVNEDYGLTYTTSLSNVFSESTAVDSQQQLDTFSSDVWFGQGNASWFPSADTDDWTMNAFGIVSQSELVASQTSTFTNVSLGLGTNYLFTPKINGNASLTNNMVSTDAGPTQNIVQGNARLTYIGDTSQLGSWTHSWTTSGGVSVFGDTEKSMDTSLNETANQSFGKVITRSVQGEMIDLRYSQDFFAEQLQIGQATGFSHAFSAGWRWPSSFAISSSFSDSYSFGLSNSHSQAFSLSGSGTLPFSITRSLSVNGYYNLNRDLKSGLQSDILTGSAVYSDSRFLNVPNLRYNALLAADTQLTKTETAGNAAGSFVGWRFNQLLTRRVGLLGLEARVECAQPQAGDFSWLVVLKVMRDFRS